MTVANFSSSPVSLGGFLESYSLFVLLSKAVNMILMLQIHRCLMVVTLKAEHFLCLQVLNDTFMGEINHD